MKEWVDIDGYIGVYQINIFGDVRSLYREFLEPSGRKHTCPEKILSHHSNPQGYLTVDLYKKRKRWTAPIHQLVAMSFIPNPLSYQFVNHKNKIRTDNRIENLEWVSARENLTHSWNTRKKTSQFTGVYKAKPLCSGHRKLWNAAIIINKKKKRLGNFYTEEEASRAYIGALKEYGITNKYAMSL